MGFGLCGQGDVIKESGPVTLGGITVSSQHLFRLPEDYRNQMQLV